MDSILDEYLISSSGFRRRHGFIPTPPTKVIGLHLPPFPQNQHDRKDDTRSGDSEGENAVVEELVGL